MIKWPCWLDELYAPLITLNVILAILVGFLLVRLQGVERRLHALETVPHLRSSAPSADQTLSVQP